MNDPKDLSSDENSEERYNKFLAWYARMGGDIAKAEIYIKNLKEKNQ